MRRVGDTGQPAPGDGLLVLGAPREVCGAIHDVVYTFWEVTC